MNKSTHFSVTSLPWIIFVMPLLRDTQALSHMKVLLVL